MHSAAVQRGLLGREQRKSPWGKRSMGQTPDARGDRRRWICRPRPWASTPGHWLVLLTFWLLCVPRMLRLQFPSPSPTEDWDHI